MLYPGCLSLPDVELKPRRRGGFAEAKLATECVASAQPRSAPHLEVVQDVLLCRAVELFVVSCFV